MMIWIISTCKDLNELQVEIHLSEENVSYIYFIDDISFCLLFLSANMLS